jgi:signal transduction histidine kinase
MADGLSDDTVTGFFQDREGDIWVTTNQGVDRFRDLPVLTYSVREGLSNNSVGAVLAASDGTLWISNFRSLDALHPDGTVTSIRGGSGFPGQPTGGLTDKVATSAPAGDRFPGQVVGSLMEDRRKRIWMGIDSGLQIFDGRTFTRVQKPGPRLTGKINAMVEDRQGGVWALSVSPNPHGSLLHFVNDKLVEDVPWDKLPFLRTDALAADPHDGIWIYLRTGAVARWSHNKAEVIDLHRGGPNATSLHGLVALANGFVIGSSSTGLSVIRDGRARTLSVREGLPCANIYSLTDTDDTLWAYSECGAIKLSHSELSRWWNDPASHPRVAVLDALDGIRAAAHTSTPGASHTADGRIWFANGSVAQMVDPRRSVPLAPLLPVRFEQLVADGRTYSTSREVALPALTKDVEIDYTSPSFAAPQRVHFRYKLEGLDDQWVDSGSRRQAFYTNLRPGTYRFHTSASGADMDWTPDSIMTFRIPPKFYQTTWFGLLCGTCALLALIMLFRLRMEMVKRDLRAKLQVRMDERERIARDLHDTLFQNIQGVLLTIDNSTNKLPEGSSVRKELKHALGLSDEVMADGRERVLNLRADDIGGKSIAQALTQVGHDLAQEYAAAFRVIELGTPENLHPLVFEEVFRICREALLNAFRHSNAARIEVEILFTADSFSIRIRDDGIGIDEGVLSEGGKPGHFGLKIMAERARNLGAAFTIRSKRSAGSEIELSMPRRLARGSGTARWSWLWIGRAESSAPFQRSADLTKHR